MPHYDTLLEELHEQTLGIVEFHEVGKNFLRVLHKVLVVVVLYELGILSLHVHSNLLHFRSLHKVVRKLPPGLHAVILRCRYWSEVLHFNLAFDVFFISFPILCTILLYRIF